MPFNFYMNVEGVEGSATGQYKGWIELESVRPMRGGDRFHLGSIGSGGSKPPYQSLEVTKRLDVSTPVLFRMSAENILLSNLTIDFVKETTTGKTPAPYLSVELVQALISGYRVAQTMEGSAKKSTEIVTFTCGKIIYSNKPTSAAKGSKALQYRTIGDLVTSSGK